MLMRACDKGIKKEAPLCYNRYPFLVLKPKPITKMQVAGFLLHGI